MSWTVVLEPRFGVELRELDAAVRVELLARAGRLEAMGPAPGRPTVDTLNGSTYPNMKALRFSAGGGVWRVAFAFDPARRAVLLVAGYKAGVKSDRFYRELIRKADARYRDHLDRPDDGGNA